MHREGNAITATDDRGTVHIPSATIGALLLGPGTNVTHQAMVVLADSGGTAIWVGEQAVRYYAHGRTMARSSRWLVRQAEIVSNRLLRLQTAREMYAMRFPDEDVSTMTMQQLRGREGARVRAAYRAASEEFGVDWQRRQYRPDDFDASDAVNQALTAATTCLYGLVHAVVVALGCAPGLGVVHTGHDRSFVYDIADLYKVEVAVPTAFEIAAAKPEDLPGEVRRRMRSAMHQAKLLHRCPRDVQHLLANGDATERVDDWDVVELWDGALRSVPAGSNYGAEENRFYGPDDVPW